MQLVTSLYTFILSVGSVGQSPLQFMQCHLFAQLNLTLIRWSVSLWARHLRGLRWGIRRYTRFKYLNLEAHLPGSMIRAFDLQRWFPADEAHTSMKLKWNLYIKQKERRTPCRKAWSTTIQCHSFSIDYLKAGWRGKFFLAYQNQCVSKPTWVE